MKLGEEKIVELIAGALANIGLPANVGDRIDAMRFGVASGIRFFAEHLELTEEPEMAAKAEDNGVVVEPEPASVKE